MYSSFKQAIGLGNLSVTLFALWWTGADNRQSSGDGTQMSHMREICNKANLITTKTLYWEHNEE